MNKKDIKVLSEIFCSRYDHKVMCEAVANYIKQEKDKAMLYNGSFDKVRFLKDCGAIPEDIPFEQTTCPLCGREMDRTEDDNVQQLSCGKCGVYYNV